MAKKKPKVQQLRTDRNSPPPETKEDRKAALRAELARLEESDQDDEEPPPKKGALARVVDNGLAALSNLGKILVEDRTPPDKNGNTMPIQRHAGRVRGVRLDGAGNVKEVDYEPDEWPPRRESF